MEALLALLVELPLGFGYTAVRPLGIPESFRGLVK